MQDNDNPNVRICRECIKVKTLPEFRKHKTGYRHICKDCYNKSVPHTPKYNCTHVYKHGKKKGQLCSKVTVLGLKCYMHSMRLKEAQKAMYERNKKQVVVEA
jgi:hypothetical protein